MLALVLAAAFHLQLQSNAAESFPLMKRFGAITIDIYPKGFRATSIWLRGFAINGQNAITIENPISRTYTKQPMSGIGDMVRFIGGKPVVGAAPIAVQITTGNVGKLPSRRYRLIYAKNDYVDVWTTSALGPVPAFRSAVDEIVRAVAPGSIAVLRKIPDTPVYVEFNMGPHRKVAMVRTIRVAANTAGEADALRVSPWMFPAPFGSIVK